MPALGEIGMFWKSNTFGVRIWRFYFSFSACISFSLSSFPSSVNKMCEIRGNNGSALPDAQFWSKPVSYLEHVTHHCASYKLICKMGLSSSQSEVSILLNKSYM